MDIDQLNIDYVTKEFLQHLCQERSLLFIGKEKQDLYEELMAFKESNGQTLKLPGQTPVSGSQGSSTGYGPMCSPQPPKCKLKKTHYS
jgi:hypothetical protein